MFNKQTKIFTGFLTLVMVLLTINCVKAVRDQRPQVTGEKEMIAELRCYSDASHLVLSKIKQILDETETERYRWSPCLLDGEDGFFGSENGHGELYRLWLIEKLNKVVPLLDAEKKIFWRLCNFVEGLMESVKQKDIMVYFCYNKFGCAAVQIRSCLIKVPGRYDYTKMREMCEGRLSKCLST